MNDARAATSPLAVTPTASISAAEVLAVEADAVMVRLHHARTEEVHRAELAVVGYLPVARDRVLVCSAADGWYVVGVLGDARVRRGDAPAGVVRIAATERIVLDAPTIEIDASRIVERAEDTYRYARGAAHSAAGSMRTVVEGSSELVAGRTTIVSDDDTVIDGSRVLLG